MLRMADAANRSIFSRAQRFPRPQDMLALALLAASVLFFPLPAQTPDATPPAAAPPAADTTGGAPAAAPQNAQVNFLQFLAQGGLVMWFLLLASIFMTWFTIEGFVFLRAGKLAPPPLIARLKEAITAGNYQEAWNLCQTNKCFLSSVLGAGLERIGRSKDAVDFAVEETSLRESTYLRTNTTFLSVIGVVSPMIGLTGTVYGMIKAFHTLGANGITNPAELASNIGQVLVATLSGLVVAVPAFVFFYILRARAQGAILYAESQVYRLLDDIPYDQLSGLKIGEDFSPDQAKARSARAGTSQKVSRNVTTNCPACNAPITVGTTPCPNCGTVLDWSS
jgi:biopolymer transport protein ExbB